ncbi:MAG: hypothetical protein IJ326_05370 [Lachnospiraceae bacterium]|nr:hypothetical protein [Lachnospiraceae bacterium]
MRTVSADVASTLQESILNRLIDAYDVMVVVKLYGFRPLRAEAFCFLRG